jgi:triacylglycerol esterase/lipase EstA (alpha/beta hydrolase family)
MSESFQTVEDLALSLIARLDSIGRSLLSAKPLVFLAHSLGGIILKRALVEMANGNAKQNFMLDAVRQIILFGVPNRGMKMSHLFPMVDGNPNVGLVEVLSQESEYLRKLDEKFNGVMLLRRIRLISVYETARTQVPQVNPPYTHGDIR